MKKWLTLLLTAALCAGLVCLPIAAFSESDDALILSAVVRAGDATALKAPASGELAAFSVRAGDAVSSGEALFRVEPQRVYADLDGAVAAVYVAPGGIADAAVARYGAVLKLEYADRYEIAANTRTGYNSPENRDLRAGMPVYLRSANEKHFADGVILDVSGAAFTVQVIGGDLVYTQDVKVYREADYGNKALLARAALSSVPPYAVTASGTVTDVAVRAGDSVKAGDYLFSYVPDALDPERRGRADATAVIAGEDLIVSEVSVQQGASVQKGQTLALVYPAGRYELVAQAEEGDVGRIHAGDTMTVRFEELDLPPAEATVTSVSPLGAEAEVSKYTVYLDFEAPEGVWPGMHATVER